MSTPGVSIDVSARVNWRAVRLQPQSSLVVGKGSIVEGSLVFERPGAAIEIGSNTFIGNSSIIASTSVQVGSDVLVAWGTTIVDHDSHSLQWSQRSHDVQDWYAGKKDWTNVTTAPVRIGDKAWIGFNVIILKGIVIGEGSVVAAGSVVTKSVQAWTLVGGNPARVIRELAPG